VWATGNEWLPAPIFQTFQAYSTTLDEVNAETLASADGPDAVLRQVAALDDKNPSWESPEYQISLACHFAEAAADEYWQALERKKSRCGESTIVEQVSVDAGQSVSVPTVDGSIVTMEATNGSGLPASLFAASTIACDETTYRLAQGLNGSPLIVAADALSWSPQFLPQSCRTVTFPTNVDITFSATSVA
jgi:hypothetical protein